MKFILCVTDIEYFKRCLVSWFFVSWLWEDERW